MKILNYKINYGGEVKRNIATYKTDRDKNGIIFSFCKDELMNDFSCLYKENLESVEIYDIRKKNYRYININNVTFYNECNIKSVLSMIPNGTIVYILFILGEKFYYGKVKKLSCLKESGKMYFLGGGGFGIFY